MRLSGTNSSLKLKTSRRSWMIFLKQNRKIFNNIVALLTTNAFHYNLCMNQNGDVSLSPQLLKKCPSGQQSICMCLGRCYFWTELGSIQNTSDGSFESISLSVVAEVCSFVTLPILLHFLLLLLNFSFMSSIKFYPLLFLIFLLVMSNFFKHMLYFP